MKERNIPEYSPQELNRAMWVAFTLDELDRIDKLVMLGGATDRCEEVYHNLMKRIAA